MSKRKFKFFVLVLSLPFCLLAQIKVGYVDSNEIMSNLDDVRKVQSDLERVQKELEGEFNEMLSSLDSLKRDYDTQRLLMSDERRKEKENELIRNEQQIQKFQLDKFGSEGEIYRKQNQLMKPVLTKIDAAIQKVGNERGYDFILDAGSGGLLFALDAHNLTELVMIELQ